MVRETGAHANFKFRKKASDPGLNRSSIYAQRSPAFDLTAARATWTEAIPISNLKLRGEYLGMYDLGNRLCVKLVFEVELALDIYMQ